MTDQDRRNNVDRTPLPVARQILREVRSLRGQTRTGSIRILDVGCGEGAWSVVAREVWPDSHITGIDIRRAAIPYARRNCDRFICGSFPEAMHEVWASVMGDAKFDIIVGNPPFSVKASRGERKRNLFPPFVRASLGMLRKGGVLCFYALNDLGQRGESTRELFHGRETEKYKRATPERREQLPRYEVEPCRPVAQFRVAGAISYRGPKQINIEGSGQSDTRCYSGWVWIADGEGGCPPGGDGWTAMDLPPLPKEDRRWVEIPGT